MTIPKEGDFIVICRSESDWNNTMDQVGCGSRRKWENGNCARIEDGLYQGYADEEFYRKEFREHTFLDWGDYYSNTMKSEWPVFISADWGFNNKKTKKPMKLNSMMKRLLDADTQTLYKAGFLNGDLEITEDGKRALFAVLFDAHKAALVVEAQAKLDAEAQTNK